MASILRSGKLLRYFAGFTRSVAFNSIGETSSTLVPNTQCICSSLTQGYVTAASKPNHDLDKQLKRLDQDVRRTGRISRRDIEEILDEIRLQKSASSSQSLLVIRCCGNLVPEELPEVRTNLVQEIWKTLNALNVPMDISHYNALLRVYLENEHPFSPTDFLADLEAKGVEPNRVTYQRLITRYCQQGDIDGATKILEFMQEKGLPVNEHVFNSLILGHSQANDLKSASGILGVMKQAGLEPSPDTYTTLLCCYARHGDLDALTSTLQEAEKQDIYLMDKDILDVIYTLTTNGHGDKVDPILLHVRKSSGFNQDCVNTILRLVNKGYEDVAYKILKIMPRATKPNGELAETGNFFIRQLVKASRPIDKILGICKNMQEENYNNRALVIATEAGLSAGVNGTTFTLLKEMKNAELPIRQHYFWPLFCTAKENSDITDVIRKMQDEFSIHPTMETVRDYIIPNLKEKNWEKVINVLRGAGITTGTAACATAYSVLCKDRLKDAADIAESYKAKYSGNLFKPLLITALSKTSDYKSFVRFVRQIYDSDTNTNNAAAQEDSESTQIFVNGPEFVGQIVLESVLYFKSNRVETIENILNGLVDQGLSMTNAYAEQIQEKIGSEMTPKISELLEKLSSGELQPIELKKVERKARSIETLSIEELERFIENVEKKGESSNNLKRHLLNACFRSKDIEKTKEVIEKLENEKFQISQGVSAQFIDLYCHHEQLENALKLHQDLLEKDPSFTLDRFKIVKIAHLFTKENKLAEAVAFLEQHKKAEFNEADNTFNYKTTVWRLLNSLADAGKVEELEKVFDALEENNYIQPSNVLLGPMVKVHLINNNVQEAIHKFEKICQKYQTTPWKNELACRLIQSEDATNLQKLTDLSTNIHGEINSLYDLVFSFVECGRIRQARKILETPGLQTRTQRITTACERYRNEGMVESLEGLVEATKDINHIDRNQIYYNLLLSYQKEDKPEKALGLWTKMQDEDITPTDTFLVRLAEFLKSKKMEVPFVVSSISKAPKKPTNATVTETKPKTTKKAAKNTSVSETVRKFRSSINSGDVDVAIQNKRLVKEPLSATDLSLYVELLVKNDRLIEANKVVKGMFEEKQQVMERIFKFYLNKLANSADYKTIESLGELIPNANKKLISYDNRLCHAYITAGQIESYLKKLKDDLLNSKTEEEIQLVCEKFPRGGALGILENHPEFISQYEDVAEAYASKNYTAPMNVLWIHNILNGKDEAAANIFEKHLKNMPRIMFQRVLQVAREKNDEQLAAKLLANVRNTKISEGALGNIYSCYLDILSTNNKAQEALDVLNNGLKDICLENFNRTALQRLQKSAESKGLVFPHKIPDKNHKNDSSSSSSSSSSSDDDVTPPKPETPKKNN